MNTFMPDDFLLHSEAATRLYTQCARNLPIIDYHCHICPQDIADDRRFSDITAAWLGGDHYKWRLMRANGVEERYITGDAPAREKFQAFADTLPKAAGNPVYHWTHMELRRYFQYDGILSGDTAETVWHQCNRVLQNMGVRDIIRQSNVELICTTDDPTDVLEAHEKIQKDTTFSTEVLPGWRPDRAINIQKPDFAQYIRNLSRASNTSIIDLDTLFEALHIRLDYFAARGCVVSDHGLDFIPYSPDGETLARTAFQAALAGEGSSQAAMEAYQYVLLRFLGTEYARRGWIMQLHFGALRNANTAMFGCLGPDTGFDSIGAPGDPKRIAGFLDSLYMDDCLPQTVLYSLNPSDNALLTSLIGCYQGGFTGKLQHGAAWWFNDTFHGIQDQLQNLAGQSLLGNFIGMLTDSRSFLSYPRHDYFRRILCDTLGNWISNGEFPDGETADAIVKNVSYENIRRYLHR